jgi:adenosylcobinamide kinase / adenosylcobinamide-phosphate guanylyltransferase
MSLTLLTGPVRSGKSDLAQRLADAAGLPVVVAVAGAASDPEMELRIDRHRAARPEGWTTLELTPAMLSVPAGPAAWLAAVPTDHLLLVDCLGTLFTALLVAHGELPDVIPPDEQERFEAACDAVVDAIAARAGDTIVVSNEVGWGVVPAYASARLFRDAVGRASRRLAEIADRALLVVAGRAIDLNASPSIEELT